ncbi:MAG: LptF/LptG family permease [Pseudomonadota bacterium]
MTIYSRHILRQTLSMLLLILISLTLVVWMATALKELKLVTSQGQSFGLFLTMTLLALPSLMAFIAPIALLIATLQVLNKVSGDSELIIVNAGGATIWHVAKPFLYLAVAVSLLLLLTSLYLQPLSLRSLKDFVIQVRTDLISKVLQAGKFSSPEKGLTIHIRQRDRNDNLLGLLIHDARNEKEILSYLAERARIHKQDGSAYLIMYNGHVQRQAFENNQKNQNVSENDSVKILAFDQYVFDLSQFTAQKKGDISYKPRERYINELLNPPDKKTKYYRRIEGKLRAETHERFASPLYPLVFVMIAIAMVGNARTTRQKSMNGTFQAFAFATLTKVAGVAASNAVAKAPQAIFLVYAIPVLTFMIAAYVAHRGMTPRKTRVKVAIKP